jgi:hypothetical protein
MIALLTACPTGCWHWATLVCACLASAVYGAGGMLALWVWHETRGGR